MSRCTTAFLALSMQESSELDLKLEETETSDTPPSLEEFLSTSGNLVVLRNQHPTLSGELQVQTETSDLI